jgi:hypothetical protein
MRLCLCILALGSNAFADMIIVGAPADAINGDPFAGPLPGFVGSRYQQAYANVDFTSRAMTITSISFFNHSPFEGPLPVASFQIFFSVITANIDSLSNTNFDSNDGLDNTLFASVDLNGGPAPFQLVFAGQPFDYNPANGNLLMDIQISNEVSGGGAFYDARSGTATGVFSRYQNFSDGTQGYGLVTQFTFEPIPEASTMVLLLGGLAGLVAACRPRRPACEEPETFARLKSRDRQQRVRRARFPDVAGIASAPDRPKNPHSIYRELATICSRLV